MQRYLFRELSPSARLQVQRMKETHQEFEVSAHRALDLAGQGDLAGARSRLPALSERAAALDSVVQAFLEARIAQREALRSEYATLTSRVRAGLIVMGIALVLLAFVLTQRLRRTVLRPLEELISVAQRISRGDALARVPDQQYVELTQVAVAFNEMADGVQGARETTEMQNEELRRSLEQLRQTQDELVQHEKLSAMGQMLAGLAHELNNPLSGVLGMAQLLRDELDTSKDDHVRRMGRDLASPLAHEAERARDLVRNLLSFARKPSETLGPVALSAAVRIAIGLRSSAYTQAGKRLEMDIPPMLYVRAESQKLQHVIVNLVNNALDAMESDGGTGLAIRARAEDNETVTMYLDDDGPGFADSSSAFDAFYTTKPADRGTGLGLALVQKFVHEFGGSVSASNRPEGGARVTLTLPRANPPVSIEPSFTPVPQAVTTSRRPTPAIGVPIRPSGEEVHVTRPRVLVVDDEAALREIQRRLLLLEDIDVVVAASGDEARNILTSEAVDLVISDLRLPGSLDGRGLHAWLSAHHPGLAERMLIVTGDMHGLSPHAELVVPEDRILAKPFTRTEYVSRVRAALGARQ